VNPELRFKLKTKLQFYFCLIGVFSVTLTSLIVYNDTKQTLEKIAFDRLTSVKEIKKKFIENYFEQLGNLALTLSENKAVISAVKNYNTSADLPSVKNEKDLGLTQIAAKFNVEDILLISTADKRIIFSLKERKCVGETAASGSLLSPEIKTSFQHSANNLNRDFYITDFASYLYNGNKPASFISVPLFDDGNIQGVIILEISVNEINNIMTSGSNWRGSGFGETAETYIIGPDFKMRTDSRFFIQEPEKYFSMLRKTGVSQKIINEIKEHSSSILLQEVKTAASEEGVRGLSSTKILHDYRGVEVVSSYSPLKITDLNWIIISEIDTNEAFSVINSLKEYLILAGILIILLASSLGVLFSRSISKPINALSETAEIFGKGNLEYRADTEWKDEFGLLFATFNTMAEKIMKNTGELKTEIDDRKRISEQLINSREQLRSLSSHLQTVREEERKLIAREIHDELGQALNTLKLKLSIYKQSGNKEEVFAEILSLIDRTINSMRRIITELRPQLLDDLGLTAAIEWQIKEFNKNSGIDCSFKITPEEINTEPEKAIAIYRILQEALTNIASHSEATCADISLTGNEKNIEITITDNGKGISEGAMKNPKSFGLLGIKERARYFGGKVEIKSIYSQGTTITAIIPNSTEEK